jgi:hypothetical protein
MYQQGTSWVALRVKGTSNQQDIACMIPFGPANNTLLRKAS